MASEPETGLAHPFAGLKVVELAEDPGGEFAGRLLAEMGADLIKVMISGGIAGARSARSSSSEVTAQTIAKAINATACRNCRTAW